MKPMILLLGIALPVLASAQFTIPRKEKTRKEKPQKNIPSIIEAFRNKKEALEAHPDDACYVFVGIEYIHLGTDGTVFQTKETPKILEAYLNLKSIMSKPDVIERGKTCKVLEVGNLSHNSSENVLIIVNEPDFNYSEGIRVDFYVGGKTKILETSNVRSGRDSRVYLRRAPRPFNRMARKIRAGKLHRN